VGIHRDLGDKLIAALNGRPARWTIAFVRIVRDIEYHDVVSSVMYVEEFPDKHPREWTEHALITFQEATIA
jgi:hypothetical protein